MYALKYNYFVYINCYIYISILFIYKIYSEVCTVYTYIGKHNIIHYFLIPIFDNNLTLYYYSKTISMLFFIFVLLLKIRYVAPETGLETWTWRHWIMGCFIEFYSTLYVFYPPRTNSLDFYRPQFVCYIIGYRFLNLNNLNFIFQSYYYFILKL